MKKINKKNLTLLPDDGDQEMAIAVESKSEEINGKNQSQSQIVITRIGDSCEIGKEAVIFKSDDIAVSQKGVRKITTGKIMSTIDPNQIDVLFLIIQLHECIGKGASGYVHKATHIPSGQVIALKSINIYDKDRRKQLKTDLKVLQENDSPYLVKFYGAFFSEGSVKLVIEYMDLGSLDKIIEKIKSKPAPCTPEIILSKITSDVRLLITKVLRGLYYLHKEKHQIHRDLKPGNILINKQGQVKLTDFGIAKALGNSSGFCNTFVGTNAYMYA